MQIRNLLNKEKEGMAYLSLKTKMSIAISLLVVALVSALAASLFEFFKRQVKKSVAEHQLILITEIASDIDDKIMRAQEALVAVSRTVPRSILKDSEQAQQFLDSRPGTHSIFDNGLFLFSAQGRLIAESPFLPGRRGRDISFRDYYKKTLADQKPHISDPYFSTHNPGKPAIILTVPLFDHQGKLTGIFAGSLDLTKDNFLGKLGQIRLGKSGYVFLFTTDGTMAVHPDRARLMKPNDPAVKNFASRASKGFEGTEERTDSQGLQILTTYKRLRVNNWVMGANYLLKEAYAPIEKARYYTLLAACCGVTFSVLIVWLGMKYLTQPLLRLSAHMKEIPDGSGIPSQIQVTSADEIGDLGLAFNGLIGRLVKKQEALQEAVLTARNEKTKSEAIIAAIGDGLNIVDIDFKVIYQNKVHQELSAGNWEGSYCYHAFEGGSEICNGCPIAMAFADGLVHTAERSVDRNGEKLYLEITASPLTDYDGNIIAGIELVRNITQRKRLEAAFEQMAFHDALTGLPNRRLFNERLSQAIAYARRNKELLAVLFVDLDHFKEINDSLGHAIGDTLLQEVAERLKGCGRRAEDTIARQGGDEFLIFLSQIKDEDDAVRLVQVLLQAMAAPFTPAGYELFISASIGISIFPDDGTVSETLVRNADTAMYRAKQKGRNSYSLYNSAMGEKSWQRIALDASLRRAMDKKELVLHYQPRVDIDTGAIIAMEALVRWNHPERGLLLPASFIPQAEETGLILELGEWILRAACTQNKAWQDAGFAPLRISVNYSLRQLRQHDFVDTLVKILEETGLEPRWLELETGESVMLDSVSENRQVLSTLRKLGVRISLDNYGTGYSSLNQLRDFPIDALKIDLSFVADIAASESSKAIARSVIGLADGLDLAVAAQGVETRDQLQLLRTLGCAEMQGIFFSRPVPAENVTRLLAKGHGWRQYFEQINE